MGEQTIQNRYELIERIGQGGMAEVWRARDGHLHRDVAVKLIEPRLSDDPAFLVRFFSEAQAAARINHPNVVQVLDFGEFDGRPFLVMELVPGGSVADLAGAPLDPVQAAGLVAQAAEGAGAAHDTGLVHRDIKPGNILLDQDGHAKLADFGISASQGGERLTATGTAIGSPHYLAPEQAKGLEASPASDVYALGAVLYELLTGKPPFTAENITAIAIAHVEKEPVPPGAHVEGIPPGLESVVMACLAKDPAARPADGAALANALQLASDGSVHPATMIAAAAAPTAPTSATRRRLLVAAACLVLIGGGIALASTLSRSDQAVAADGPNFDRRLSGDRTATPTPTPTATEEDLGVQPDATSPSPSPSVDEPEEDKEPPEKRETGGDGDAPDDNQPREEPEEEQAPTPSGTPEPEPTSAPESPATEDREPQAAGEGGSPAPAPTP